MSAANDSRVSAPLALATSTRIPRSRAASTPASHNVVLPMPASPLSTSARAGDPAPRKRASTTSSESRPMTPTCTALPGSSTPLLSQTRFVQPGGRAR